MWDIASAENKELRRRGRFTRSTTPGADGPDRKWILDTYAECLRAARGERIPSVP
jgi:hypothetical protein